MDIFQAGNCLSLSIENRSESPWPMIFANGKNLCCLCSGGSKEVVFDDLSGDSRSRGGNIVA